MTRTSRRIQWRPLLEKAAEIVKIYDTGVTLRQLFYRLVAAVLLPNTQVAYKTLSARTAEARREGWFPDLIDETREIHEYRAFESPQDGQKWLCDNYRRDRTEGQEWSIYLGVEKRGIVAQLMDWFGELGIPVVSLGGYTSQTYADEVFGHVRNRGRPAVLIYAGDHDPSGEDIDRDFLARCPAFDTVRRVALNAGQIEEHDLPPQPGKAADPRAASFIERHGELVQVELDALPPDVLRGLYQEAIDEFWDTSQWESVVEREGEEEAQLREVTDEL